MTKEQILKELELIKIDLKNEKSASFEDVEKLMQRIKGEEKSPTVCDLFKKIKEKATLSCGYYNGGWIKTVIGVNKKATNGYSITGDFVQKQGTFPYKDGLYLCCSIEGSRKNRENNYILFSFDGEKVEVIKEIEDGRRDWAVLLWEHIENFYNIENNILNEDNN